MGILNGFCALDSKDLPGIAQEFGTPLYLYDEAHIIRRCHECLNKLNSFGLNVRYAMKANSNKRLLRIISGTGLHMDASSLNEVIRANLAGIPYENVMLTTQESPVGDERVLLEELMLKGLKYNVCSLRQLRLIADFAVRNGISLGIRVHPGFGTGESATRNTGDDYACFGVHLSDLDEAISFAKEKQIAFTHLHEHIGSGGDIEIWRQNISMELAIAEKYFPDVTSVSFGGGLKESRMPDEPGFDHDELGRFASRKVDELYERTGRKLKIEIEPGTYIMANSGYALTRVIDKKKTSRSNFIVTDGGMDINCRPLLYGSRHPFYVVSSADGSVRSSEFNHLPESYSAVIVGSCCESGDSQTLSCEGRAVPRTVAEPEIGDIVVIGGTGAYCSSMTPFNYNSHTQIPEVLFTVDGRFELIRRRQTVAQIIENEI